MSAANRRENRRSRHSFKAEEKRIAAASIPYCGVLIPRGCTIDDMPVLKSAVEEKNRFNAMAKGTSSLTIGPESGSISTPAVGWRDCDVLTSAA